MPSTVKKLPIRADSDQEMEDVEEAQQQGSGDEQAGDAGEDEEDEEYEIEEIIDAKAGVFAEGRVGYLVKWKGYNSDHNSWVSEADAQNAGDLIEEYWKKPRNKKMRKSEVKAKPTPRGQKSASARGQSSDAEAAPQKKRGRPPKAVAHSVSDDDDEEPPKTKKAKQVTKPAQSTRKTKAKEAEKDVEPDEEMADGEEQFIDIKKLKNLDDWSPFVESIDTIERTDEGTLFVYFILNAKGKSKVGDTKHRCREQSTVCRQKMPQRLLDFYENNLRWRKLDAEASDE